MKPGCAHLNAHFFLFTPFKLGNPESEEEYMPIGQMKELRPEELKWLAHVTAGKQNLRLGAQAPPILQ